MADVEISTKKINELTAQAEAEDGDLLAIGNNETGLLKKITVKNHAESIKNTIIGESEEIADIADGTVVGAIKQFDSDIPETQGIITEAFSETETYAVGDICIYDNKLYMFKEAKDAGEWNSEIAEETTVDKLLNQKNDLVSDAFDETKTYAEGDYCIYNNTLYKFKEEKTAGSWDDDPELVEAVTVMGELNSALAYQKGERWTGGNNLHCLGYTTSSQSILRFTIHVGKSLENISNISGYMYCGVRHSSGTYIMNDYGDLSSLGTVSFGKQSNYDVLVSVTLNTALSLGNNCPVIMTLANGSYLEFT